VVVVFSDSSMPKAYHKFCVRNPLSHNPESKPEAFVLSLVHDTDPPKVLSQISVSQPGSHLDHKGFFHALQQIPPKGGLLPLASVEQRTPLEVSKEGPDASLVTAKLTLIRIEPDKLTEAGSFSFEDIPRRFHADPGRLVILGSERVRSLDVVDPDKPTLRSEKAIERRVFRVLPVGDELVRLKAGPWSRRFWMEKTLLADGERGEPILAGKFPDEATPSFSDSMEMFHIKGHAVALSQGSFNRSLASLDLSASPEDFLPGITMNIPGISCCSHIAFSNPERPIQIGNDLLLLGAQGWASLNLVRLEDPKNPILEQIPFEGYTANHPSTLLQAESTAYFSHHMAPGCQFVLQRVDLSATNSPQKLPTINLPGSLFHVEEASKILLTISYENAHYKVNSFEDCPRDLEGQGTWPADSKVCLHFNKTLHASTLDGDSIFTTDSLKTDTQERWISDMRVAGGNLFGILSERQGEGGGMNQSLVTLGDLKAGKFNVDFG
jgi:hypothetical protein